MSSSSHFALSGYSKLVNPVMFPPGCARLLMNPSPTGSTTSANTIGIVEVCWCNARNTSGLLARITSGAVPTSSAAYSGESWIGRTKAINQLGHCDQRSSPTRQDPAQKLRREPGILDPPQRFRSARQSAAHRASSAAAHAAQAATPRLRLAPQGTLGGSFDHLVRASEEGRRD